MPIKISVVIPTYNRPLSLKKCLYALQIQCFTKEEYEIIVITDGPDAETEKMLEQYRDKPDVPPVIHHTLPEKKGPAAARNLGVKISRGQLILFTDDDCIPLYDWVSNYHRAFEVYGQKEVAFSGKIIVPVSDKPTDFELNTACLERVDFVTANCACSKIAFERVNGFDEAFTMAWHEDSDLEFRFLNEGVPIVKVKEALVVHPVREVVWGISLKEQKKSMFNALLFKKHPRLYRLKINAGPLWEYYLIVIFVIGFVLAGYYKARPLALLCFAAWSYFVGAFTSRRLANTSRSFSHTLEMIVTSILIPFVSVYWKLYGSFKFKVFHL